MRIVPLQDKPHYAPKVKRKDYSKYRRTLRDGELPEGYAIVEKVWPDEDVGFVRVKLTSIAQNMGVKVHTQIDREKREVWVWVA